MEAYLLGRDETVIEAAIVREIEELGVTTPFLDIGAGSGLWVAMVRQRDPRSFGIDLSHRLVLAARKRHRLNTLVVGDACRLPFPSACFNWIQLGEMIEHVSLDRGQALVSEAFRVLRSGGSMRVTTPNRLMYLVPTRRPWQRLAGLLGRSDDLGHLHEYWPWEIQRVLRRAGFMLRSVRFRAPNRYLPWKWLSAGVEIIAVKPS